MDYELDNELADPSGWFKSTASKAGGECVETKFLSDGRVGLRDSKNPGGPALVFTPGEWDTFTAGVISGEFRA
ncbi:DUF397 domain-containing protein [Nocardia sp. NPDC051030]|uniref:DUF397 domain-containing protein n=1 Tax=Nocardia sp. NPDC051030 TaxID=3155162 RepID=UPI003420C3D2